MLQFILVLLCATTSLEFVLKSKDHVQTIGSSGHHLTLIEDDVKIPTEFRGPAFRSVSGTQMPGGRIPYVLDKDIVSEKLKALIIESIADFDNYTCVRWIPKTDNDNTWVEFHQTADTYFCGRADSIGMHSGRNEIEITCIEKHTVVHEMMHKMGFHHEQNRSDRDDAMDMMYYNMGDANDEFIFDHSDLLGLPYDLQSVMHYGLQFGNIDSDRYSMMAKDPCETVSRKTKGMSRLDKLKINKYYKCSGIHGIEERASEKEYNLTRVWINGTSVYKCFMEANKAVPKAVSCVDQQNMKRYKKDEIFSIGEYKCRCDINSDAKEGKIIILSGCDNFTYTEWIMGRYAFNYECDRSESQLIQKIVGCTTPMNLEPKNVRYVPKGIVRNAERINNDEIYRYYCIIYQNGRKAKTELQFEMDGRNITLNSRNN